jgi:hypothetical protein
MSPDRRGLTTGYRLDSGDSFRKLTAYLSSGGGIHAHLAKVETGGIDPAYQAWEDVRKIRATELVGMVTAPDGKRLPYTGFEGYFAGMTPQEIIETEIKLGEKLLRSIHHHLEHSREPKTGITFNISESGLKTALHGGRISPRNVREIIKFYDVLLQMTLAMAKANTLPGQYENFRTSTYQRVAAGRATAPSEYAANSTVVALKNQQEVEAYMALAQIGVFGHPEVRAINEHDY